MDCIKEANETDTLYKQSLYKNTIKIKSPRIDMESVPVPGLIRSQIQTQD